MADRTRGGTVKHPVVALLVSSLAALGCASAPAETESSSPQGGLVELEVRVLGLDSREGAVAVAVFDSEASFEARSDAVASARLPVEGEDCSWRLSGLAPGVYAIAVYHDRDDDGVLDRSRLGLPTEPYGFSNGARGRVGPPSFRAASVTLGPGSSRLEIVVR
jgi:uncharacterized protein (DUF2141 family)